MSSERTCSLLGRAAAVLLLATSALPPGAVLAGTDARDLPAPAAAVVDLSRAHAENAILVKFAANAAESDKVAARRAAGAVGTRAVSRLATGVERLQLGADVAVERAIAALKSNPAIEVAEPDYIVTSQDTSNDPYYTGGSLWGMQGDGTTPANTFGSGAGEAWTAGYTGSRSVVVGVIDEGIQYTHPDLAANIWTNPGEIAGNSIDDDGNGYIDDVHGWDFYNKDAGIYDAGYDSHGTHVSGTIGGIGGNGAGVAGVNWQVTIISAKFLGPNGGYTSDAISALDYLTDLKLNRGVNLVASSNSWGGGGFDSLLLAAINRSGDAGMLFVAAAGNNGTNTDSSANYPSTYQCTNGGTRGWDCVVAVAAIDSSGAKASFSNWGATTVDLGAPGVGINSTLPTDSYGSYSGTSMATPHVSGAVALCKSMSPTMTAAQIRAALVNSAAPTASLSGLTVTGGRLDVGALIALCHPATSPVSGGAGSSLAASPYSPTKMSLAWSDGSTNEETWELQQSPAGCASWTTVANTGANATSFQVSGLQAQTSYCFRVRATNSYNGGSQSAWSNVATATTPAPSAPYTCSSTSYAWIDASAGGTALSMTDDSATTVALPFTYFFYGEPITALQVSSNGYVRLDGGAATGYANTGIPSATDPNGFIAALWDDLNPGAGGSVWVRTVGSAGNRQFVAEWLNVPQYSVSGSAATFEIVLDEATGAATLQYQDVVFGNATYDYGLSATSGIENLTGSAGTQVSYNTAALANLTAKRCTNNNTAAPPAITTTSLPDGTTGTFYSAQVQAVGGQSPYTFSLTGSLPGGLSLSSSGAITGTPSSTGTSSFGVTVTGSDGAGSVTTLSIRVASPLSVATSSFVSGNVGTSYSASLAASGGQSPYTWSVFSGSLPSGLTLNGSTGAITGTPTTTGTAAFTIQVTDTGLPTARTATKALSITVNAAAPATFGKLSPKNAAKLSTTTSAALSWSASSGATGYDVCVSTTSGACSGTWVSVGNVTSWTATGLKSRASYWWQVRATNGAVQTLADAGSWWKFTTK